MSTGVLPTPSRHARNRLAGIVLAALHDVDARRELAALAADARHDSADAATLRERARAAERALADVPVVRAGTMLQSALADAAALFAAGLYFEVHEVLEPVWRDAGSATRGAAPAEAREPLQGVIQIAVGYQHLANGNVRGARALLTEGAARVTGRVLAGRSLDAFAAGVRASLDTIDDLDEASIPRFPPAAEGDLDQDVHDGRPS